MKLHKVANGNYSFTQGNTTYTMIRITDPTEFFVGNWRFSSVRDLHSMIITSLPECRKYLQDVLDGKRILDDNRLDRV